jgi:hypothetical protein
MTSFAGGRQRGRYLPPIRSVGLVCVIGLPGNRLGEAAAVLACGFHNNRNFVELSPDERVRARPLPRLQTASLRDALGFGHVYVAAETHGFGGRRAGRGGGLVATGWIPALAVATVSSLRDMARILGAALGRRIR